MTPTMSVELQSLIPPLTDDELAQLEQNILTCGVRDPVVVWAQEQILLDGHHRVRLAEKHGLPYSVHEVSLASLDEAKAWMYANQLGRRNLSPDQLSYYRGQLYNLSKHQGQRTDRTSGKSCQKSGDTATHLAAQHQVSDKTIRNDAQYARAIETLATTIGAEARQALLARETPVDRHGARSLALIATASPQTARHVLAAVQTVSTPKEASQLIHAALKSLPTPEKVATNGHTAPWVETVLADDGRSMYIVHDPDSHPVFNETNEMVDWASKTWNPVTGCWFGCPWCYAREIAHDARMAQIYPQDFEPTFWPDRLRAPANTRPPAELTRPQDRNVFVCSMADLFGKWVPDAWIVPVFEQVAAHPAWTFLFLTKSPQRLPALEQILGGFPANAWLGCTVDVQARVTAAERAFRQITATVKWVSVEPMLERITFHDLAIFDWVVLGGLTESHFNGTAAFQPAWKWVDHLCDQAKRAGVDVYWKENLTVRPKAMPWRKEDV